MQAFFFSTYRRFEEALDYKVLPFLKSKKINDKLVVFYGEGLLSEYWLKEKDYYIANLGCFIYKDKFNREAIEELDKEVGRNCWEVGKSHGQYAVLVLEGEKVIVITDKYRTIPVYMKKTKKGVEVSNVYSLLVDEDCTIYSGHVRKLIEVDWDYPEFYGATFHDEIRYLDPATVHIFNSKTGEVKTNRYCPPSYYNLSFDELINKLADRVESNFEFLKNIGGKVFCDITGGFDSRLNIEYVLRNCKEYTFGNDISSNDKHLIKGRYSDLNIVREIEKVIGRKSLNFIGSETLLEEAVNNWEYENSSKYNDSHIMSDKRFLNNRIISMGGHKLRVTGWAGTEMLTIKPSKGKWVIKDGLSIWKDSMMNCQQNYWGVANMILPHYSPYLDLLDILVQIPRKYKRRYQIQRALNERLMRKELREVNTTHGFPACNVTFKNFYRFLRLYSLFKDYNCQYVGIVRRSIRWIKSKLIYYSPLYKNQLKRVGCWFGYDMDFLDRDHDELLKYIEPKVLNRKFLNRQQLLWLKKLNDMLNSF